MDKTFYNLLMDMDAATEETSLATKVSGGLKTAGGAIKGAMQAIFTKIGEIFKMLKEKIMDFINRFKKNKVKIVNVLPDKPTKADKMLPPAHKACLALAGKVMSDAKALNAPSTSEEYNIDDYNDFKEMYEKAKEFRDKLGGTDEEFSKAMVSQFEQQLSEMLRTVDSLTRVNDASARQAASKEMAEYEEKAAKAARFYAKEGNEFSQLLSSILSICQTKMKVARVNMNAADSMQGKAGETMPQSGAATDSYILNAAKEGNLVEAVEGLINLIRNNSPDTNDSDPYGYAKLSSDELDDAIESIILDFNTMCLAYM